MAIAHDASTIGGVFPTGGGSFVHTPVGTPKGVIVVIAQEAVTSNQISRVTYGGVDMIRVLHGPSVLGGEDSYVTIFFLGKGIPPGPQTVTEVHSPFDVAIVCHTVTATGDTQFDVSAHASSVSQANPSLPITPSAPACIYYGLQSGSTAGTATVEAGSIYTAGPLANDTSGRAWFARKTVAGAGPTTIGFTHVADDVNHCAISVVEENPIAIIAHDAQTTPALLSVNGVNNFTHTPVAVPQGVVAIFGHEDIGSLVDRVSAVSYGGVAMTRILRSTSVGELSSVEIYFLGSNIPPGPQTFSFSYDNVTGNPPAPVAVIVNTLKRTDGVGTTIVDVFNSSASASGSPSLAITPTAEAVLYYGVAGGAQNPPYFSQLFTQHQFGWTFPVHANQMMARKHVAGAGATTIGYDGSGEDVNQAAIAITPGIPPDTFIDSAVIDDTTNTATFTFSASEPGSTFECSLDGAAFTPCTTPSVYAGLADGPHTFAVRASFEGNTDPTPATHEFTLNPPTTKPTRPSLRGRLGCSVNKAHVTWRCGFPRLCSLVGVTDIFYNRALDDISEAQVTISIAGTDDICCECLGDIEPWCHELHITRDGEDTWVGPITEITYGYDTVVIKALDILGWLRVRIADSDLPNPPGPLDLTEIAQQIIDEAFEDDSDGPCALDYVVSEPTGIVLDLNFPAFTDNAFDQLEQLSDLGLDFTVVGRSIILGPEDFPVAPIATLKDEHIIGEVELTKNGNLQGNRWFVHYTGDAGIPAVAEAAVQCYGRIERLRSEDTALQTLANAEETAQSYVDAAATAPRLIEVPPGSQLAPETPWQLAEMIPGARVDVSLTKLCVDATQSFRLVGVEVNQDSEGEKVSITLSPVNQLSGDI